MLPLFTVVGISGLLIAFYVHQQNRRTLRPNLRGRKFSPNPEARKRMLEKHTQLRDLCAEMRENAKARVTVADIMTKSVTAVAENTPVDAIIEHMRTQCTRHLVVQDQSGRPVGVVSDRDVFRDGYTAREIMAANPVTVASSSTIGNAVAFMLTNRISCLPVVDDDCLSGIVTTTDMLMVLECFVDYYERERQGTSPVAIQASSDELLRMVVA